MSWRVALGAVLLLPVCVFALWWVWPVAPLPAAFALENCRLAEPTDADTGAPIIGIEDLALSGDRDIYLSAYDRITAEAELADGRPPASGGLYRLEIGKLASPEPVSLNNLIDPATLTGGFHPHGIHAAGGKLLVIDRALASPGGPATRVLVYEDTAGRLRLRRQIESPDLCAANDLALEGDTAIVTLDRADCPGLSPSDALDTDGSGSLAMASVSHGGLETIATGLAFPNGVVYADTGRGLQLFVAETRARRLRVFPADAAQGGPATFIELPGGPDNLSLGPEGKIVAALHPHLLRLAAYKFGWAARAPSRIVEVDPETAAVEILFDDPDGALLPGITSALLTGEGERAVLIAGAARAPGVLYCWSAS